MKITSVKSFQIYDSRGLPTVACEIVIDNKYSGLSMVPSGASTGQNEALELRDKDNNNWFGKGVNKAIQNINQIISSAITGFSAFAQKELDNLLINLDNSANKSNLGANAILAVSLAYCRACANAKNKPLFQYIREDILNNSNLEYCFPIVLVNVLNGGRHANNNLSFQEIMLAIMPKSSIEQTLKVASECFLQLEKIISKNNWTTAKGDEGGFSINFDCIEKALDLLLDAIKQAGYIPGKDVKIALDVAASEFFKDNYYYLFNNNELNKLTSDQLLTYYLELIKKYPIISIEDPFDQNDWCAFSQLTNVIGNKLQIVGDDLYCTNQTFLKKGIQTKASNAILIKLNQIGTLSECLDTIKIAEKNNFASIISHRSGETEDTFIVDLLLATNSQQLKTGSFSRSERLAKYNRFLQINALIKKLEPPKGIDKKWK